MAPGLLESLLTVVRDPWAGVEGWRKRRETLYKPSEPTYTAYPDVVEVPALRLYVEARDVRGRLIREYVDLSGYSLHHINFASRRWQSGLSERIAGARTRIEARLAEARALPNTPSSSP